MNNFIFENATKAYFGTGSEPNEDNVSDDGSYKKMTREEILDIFRECYE